MQGLLQMADENKLVSWLPVRWTPPMRLVTGCSCDRKARHSSTRGVQGWFRRTRLVLLSQKVAANGEQNHLFGKIHTSAMGGWNGSAKIE
jgi:hypothetical protein